MPIITINMKTLHSSDNKGLMKIITRQMQKGCIYGTK